MNKLMVLPAVLSTYFVLSTEKSTQLPCNTLRDAWYLTYKMAPVSESHSTIYGFLQSIQTYMYQKKNASS